MIGELIDRFLLFLGTIAIVVALCLGGLWIVVILQGVQ